MFLKSHGGAKIKFVGEAFNVVGDVGEDKKCGGAWKIVGELKKVVGEPIHGGCYRGVFLKRNSFKKAWKQVVTTKLFMNVLLQFRNENL